jgi:hypothetical protein
LDVNGHLPLERPLPDSSAIYRQVFSVSHMKQKTLIEIPPYYIDTLD